MQKIVVEIVEFKDYLLQEAEEIVRLTLNEKQIAYYKVLVSRLIHLA